MTAKSTVELLISRVTGKNFELFFCFLHFLDQAYLPGMVVGSSYT